MLALTGKWASSTLWVHVPLIPKILRSLGYLLTSRMVRPWCQPRPAKFWATRNCRAAEYSEYLEIFQDKSR